MHRCLARGSCALFAVLVTLSTLGCRSSVKRVVGTWEGDMQVGAHQGTLHLRAPMTLQLRSDRTYSLSLMGEAGKYTFDDNEVTLRPQGSNNQPASSAEDKTKHLLLSDDGKTLRETDEVGPGIVVEFKKQL